MIIQNENYRRKFNRKWGIDQKSGEGIGVVNGECGYLMLDP